MLVGDAWCRAAVARISIGEMVPHWISVFSPSPNADAWADHARLEIQRENEMSEQMERLRHALPGGTRDRSRDELEEDDRDE